MEETLGKRIVRCRKGLGLTQDALAEKLGVTAQAVSKWENDQSCPDITMLPKLAQVFSITTDELLGLAKQAAAEAEVAPDNAEKTPEGVHIHNGLWELHWDCGRKSAIGFAVWLLIAGLAGIQAAQRGISLWSVLWSSGLFVFGLFGLYPKFSVFRLGCTVAGWFFLMDDFVVLHIPSGLLLPVLLLLIGLSLLGDALRKPRKPHFHISHDGKPITGTHGKFISECSIDADHFDCSTTFGEDHRLMTLPRLSSGDMNVAFGHLTVDLSGCEEIAPGCVLDASCCFGKLEVLIPRKWRVEPDTSTAFGSVEFLGSPAPDAEILIRLDCSASFGQILLHYI